MSWHKKRTFFLFLFKVIFSYILLYGHIYFHSVLQYSDDNVYVFYSNVFNLKLVARKRNKNLTVLQIKFSICV